VIALAALVAVNVMLVGGSFLLGTLTPAVLPALPEAPAKVVAGIEMPAVPLTDAPQTKAPQADVPPTAAPVGAATAPGDYLVAVGLFSSPERADQLVDELSQAGLPAMQRPFRLRRGEVQQIVLGPVLSRADAVADRRRLQALGGYDDSRVFSSQ
jgi:cell division septation protein DedD